MGTNRLPHKHWWWGRAGPAPQACALSGNQRGDLLVCDLLKDAQPSDSNHQGWEGFSSQIFCVVFLMYKVVIIIKYQ